MNISKLRWLILLAAVIAAMDSVSAKDVILLSTHFTPSRYTKLVIFVTADERNVGRHVGVVLNAPSKRRLAAFFPNHPPSQKTVSTVMAGGPFNHRALAALSFTTTGGARLARDTNAVDETIQQFGDNGRYFIGWIEWYDGELASELAKGWWYTRYVSPDILFHTRGPALWEHLIQFHNQSDGRGGT